MTSPTGKTKGIDPRTMVIVLGLCYVCFAGFGLMMSYAQMLFLELIPTEMRTPQSGFAQQSQFASQLHGIWRIYLPILMLIGLLYMVFGWRMPHLSGRKSVFSLLLVWLSGLCAVSYVVQITPFLLSFSQTMPGGVFFRAMSVASGATGAIFCLAMATIPQIMIHRMLKKHS